MGCCEFITFFSSFYFDSACEFIDLCDLFDVYLVCTVRYIAMDNELLCHSIPYLSGDNRAVCNASDTDSKQGIHSPVKSPRPNKSNAVSYLGLPLTTQTDTCCS